MSSSPETDDLVAELQDRTYTTIAYIIRNLAQSYNAKINDALAVNNAILNTVSQMVGEMIACYPENEREEVSRNTIEHMNYAQDMMVLELDPKTTPPSTATEDTLDLANMTPKGNC
jgi:hypothetical protein